MTRRTIFTALCTALVLLTTSCRHKDLYMGEDFSQRVIVKFDWRKAPEADHSSMAMYLYSDDAGQPARYIFTGRDGGAARVAYGTYTALCINADNTSWARLRRMEALGTFEISTPDAEALGAHGISTRTIPRARGSEDERMAQTPGMLHGDVNYSIRIVPHPGTDTIPFYPDELVCHYTVDIYDVENLSGIEGANIDATLSGMAEGVNVSRSAGTDTPVTMPFVLTADPAARQLHAQFLTFGECENTSAAHPLTVYMVLSDGSRWYHTFDVADQIAAAPDPHHVHIVLHGLTLPEPGTDTGAAGLIPDVNEWQEIHITLPM